MTEAGAAGECIRRPLERDQSRSEEPSDDHEGAGEAPPLWHDGGYRQHATTLGQE